MHLDCMLCSNLKLKIDGPNNHIRNVIRNVVFVTSSLL